MLTEEAVKVLVETCREGVQDPVIYPSREPGNVFYVYNPHTKEYDRKVAKLFSNTSAETVASVIDQSLTLATAEQIDQVKVYYTPGNNTQNTMTPSNGVVIYSVIGGNTVTQKVPHSDQFLTLQAWAADKNGKVLTQGELYTYLRTMFFGCLAVDSVQLTDIVKTLDFSANQQARVEMQSQKTSVSRKLMAEVNSNGIVIPEVVTFDIPVYRGCFADIRANIMIALIVDAEAQRFKMYVLPNQIDAAIEKAAIVIHNRIAAQVDTYDPSVAVAEIVAVAGDPPADLPAESGDVSELQREMVGSPTLFAIYRGNGPYVASNGKP